MLVLLLLACVVMASARESDHGSVNRLEYRELAPSVYEGPQGDNLQDFVELHEHELKHCHVGIDPSLSGAYGRCTNRTTRTWVKKLTDGTGKGPAQNFSETYTYRFSYIKVLGLMNQLGGKGAATNSLSTYLGPCEVTFIPALRTAQNR